MQEKKQLQTPNASLTAKIIGNEHCSILLCRKEHPPSLAGAGARACARTAAKAMANTNAAITVTTPMLARDTAMDLETAQPHCERAARKPRSEEDEKMLK